MNPFDFSNESPSQTQTVCPLAHLTYPEYNFCVKASMFWKFASWRLMAVEQILIRALNEMLTKN